MCAIQDKDSSAYADVEIAAHFFRNKSAVSFTHVAVLDYRQDLNAIN